MPHPPDRSRRPPFGRVVRLFLPAALFGCSMDASRDGGPVVRDSLVEHRGTEVTVRIVENRGSTAASTWSVLEEPAIDIGGADAPESAMLHRVAGAARLSGGYIAVADRGSSSIRVFDRQGGLAAVIGGPGEGPGEFASMHYFGRLPGDSLLVHDLQLGRISVFDADGGLAREARLGATAAFPPSSIDGVFSDGSLLARGFIDLGGGVPSGMQRMEGTVYRLEPHSGGVDTLGAVFSEAFFVPLQGGWTVFDVPFARRSSWIAAGDRIVRGQNDVAELVIADLTMRPLLVVRWAAEPLPVDGAARAGALAAALDDVRDDDQRRQIERVHDELRWPARMPVFGSVLPDDEGNLWVERFRAPGDEGPATWWVFDRDGELSAAATLPEGLIPRHIGSDFVLGTWRDELDVEHVRLHPLRKE